MLDDRRVGMAVAQGAESAEQIYCDREVLAALVREALLQAGLQRFGAQSRRAALSAGIMVHGGRIESGRDCR